MEIQTTDDLDNFAAPPKNIKRTTNQSDFSNSFGYPKLPRTFKSLKTPAGLKERKTKERGIQLPTQQNRLIYRENIGNFRTKIHLPPPKNDDTQLPLPNFGQRYYSARSTDGKRRRDPNKSFEIATALSFFSSNVQKYEPLKTVEIKQPTKTRENTGAYHDDVSSNNNAGENAFLTGVLIEGKLNNENEDNDESKFEVEGKSELGNVIGVSAFDEDLNRSTQQKERKSFLPECVRVKNPNKSMDSAVERMRFKSSEENYKHMTSKKPKIYISAKANTVQQYGRPDDQTEHLFRVFYKEGTPTVIYPMHPQFKARRTLKRQAYEAYLVDYNPQALSAINEDAYNAFYKSEEKEKDDI